MAGTSQHKAGHDDPGAIPENSVRADILLTKTEMIAIHVCIGGIDPRVADGRARRDCGLFETLLITTSRASLGRRRFFLFESALTH
jgi:hypothetical protein